jgi:predicted lipoprotein with Yx(FWY)xxD motif
MPFDQLWRRLDTKKVLVALVIVNTIAIGLSEIQRRALVEGTIRAQNAFQTRANRLAEQQAAELERMGKHLTDRVTDTNNKVEEIYARMTKVLADKNHMTLYTFDKDTDGRPTCVGPCAETWPPYTDGVELDKPGAPSVPGPWSAVARDDGSKMWAYKGKPVYFFKNDKAPGDVNGDGVNGVWHVVHLP